MNEVNTLRAEGRRHAADCLLAVIGAPKAMFDARGALGTVLDNLKSTAERCPGEYAEGIREVLAGVEQLVKEY